MALSNPFSGLTQEGRISGRRGIALPGLDDVARASGSARRRASLPLPSRAVSPALVAGGVMLLDFLVILITAAAVFAAFVLMDRSHVDMMSTYLAIAAVGGILYVQRLLATGAYRLTRLAEPGKQLRDVAAGWAIAIPLLMAAMFVVHPGDSLSRSWILTWAAAGLLALGVERIGVGWLLRRLSTSGVAVARRLAVIGQREWGDDLLERLGIGPQDYITSFHPLDSEGMEADDEALGQLMTRLREVKAELVLVLPIAGGRERERMVLEHLREIPADILYAPQAEQTVPHRGAVTIGQLPALRIWDKPLNEWQQALKRLEDIVIAGIALLFMAPLLAIIAVAIKLDSPGPIIFRQPRFGFNNQRFDVLKFRSMYVEKGDVSGGQRTVRDDPRVTRLGNFLRKSSIDELPQLWNVIRGDMSVVGPRAHPVAMKVEEELYHEAVEQYFARHRVRPGITGWAQVSGLRGEVDTLEKARLRVAYDLYYVENWAISFDLRIILLTLLRGFVGKNAY